MTKLSQVYNTKETKFVNREGNWLYLNSACQTALSYQSKEAGDYFDSKFGICSSRGDNKISQDVSALIEETRETILENLGLDSKDWEVVFTKNATEALNMASWLIAEYIKNNYSIEFSLYCSPFAHNSLYLPSLKIKRHYPKSVWFEMSINDIDYANYSNGHPEILFIPYIDNLFGYGHFEHYLSMMTNAKYRGIRKEFRHIILDATQGALSLLNPKNKYNRKDSLQVTSAICFSGHKAHSTHLGILVIRKEIIKNVNLLEIKGLNIGGGNIQYLDESNIPVFWDNHKGLESGLLNVKNIIQFGAFNHHLKYKVERNYSLDIQKEVMKFKSYLQSSSILPNIEKLPISRYIKPNHSYLDNNIVTIFSTHFVIDDLYERISDKKVDVRKNNFCCDYAFNRYKIPCCIRLSFDWSSLVEKDEKIFTNAIRILSEINQDYIDLSFL